METLVVKLITSDFKEANYNSTINCPLAKAIKRMFPEEDFVVGVYSVGKWPSSYSKALRDYYNIPPEWNKAYIEMLIEMADRGEEVTQEVVLTKISD